MEPAIEAIGLVKRYWIREGGFIRGRKIPVEALKGVSFKARWGEIYGLLGPNGAGKTTTVKIIVTLLLPDEGEARVAGYSSVTEPREVRRRIGVMLTVERGFFWKLTGRENLKYFGMLYGLEGPRLDARIEEVLEVTGLKELGGDKRRFEDMSLGMRARLGLARALLKDPPVLVLDEPTLGLDPPSARHIRRLLKELAGSGKAILLTTHNMHEAEEICDRIGIIVDGRIKVEGAPEELKGIVKHSIPIMIRVRGDRDTIQHAKEEIMEAMGVKATITGKDLMWSIRVLARPGGEEAIMEGVIDLLARHGVKVLEVRVEKPSLEDVFIEVAGGSM